ncbi:MAG: ribosomal protein L7/L12 [Dermatophilaceae bacterium]
MPDDEPTDPEPAVSTAKGLKGWLQRRAESALRKPSRASAAFTEPGECHVVLQLVGPKPIQVMAVIAQATGMDLLSARDLAQDTPAVLVSGISETSADRVVARLQKAGAKAIVGDQYQPQ